MAGEEDGVGEGRGKGGGQEEHQDSPFLTGRRN